MADGEPLLLEQVFLPEARFPGLLASDLEHGSLYELLTERYDTQVVRAREALEPIALPAREAQLLGVEPHRPALLIEGVAFDRDGTPVEFARSYVRGDRTRYYVERVVDPLESAVRDDGNGRRRTRPADHHAPQLTVATGGHRARAGGAHASDPSLRRDWGAGARRRRVRRDHADARAPADGASAPRRRRRRPRRRPRA